MPDMNYTDITFVIDKSGSMGHLVNDTIGGFNSFIADQRKLPGKCRVSLIQFNDSIFPSFLGKDLKEVPDLNESTYHPGGWTALYDAIGNAIVSAGDRFNSLTEDDRPGKVLFVIITDGQENSSKEYSGARVREMIEHQKSKYAWNFTFIGSDLDSLKDAKYLGISQSFAYNNTSAGVKSVYAAMSMNTRSYREGTCAMYVADVAPLDVEKSSGDNK